MTFIGFTRTVTVWLSVKYIIRQGLIASFFNKT